MRSLLLLTGVSLAAPLSLASQQPAPPPAPPPEATPLAVGADAEDFTLSAATLDGVSATPIRLRDLRDQTVVIAFFFRARSSG